MNSIHMGPCCPIFNPQDPYPCYAAMRAAHGDVYWDNEQRVWSILGYDAAKNALTDERFSSNTSQSLVDTSFPRATRSQVEPLRDYFKQWLFYQDPPGHTALRRQISSFFSQQAINAYEADVIDVVKNVCDPLCGEFDFVKDVANIIPARVMARFLSLPEQDAAMYLSWTFTMTHFFDAPLRMPQDYHPALKVLADQKAYFSEIRYKNINADWTLLPMLLATGIETSTSFLAGSCYVLLSNSDAWVQLNKQPELLDAAIDELLRLEPPVHKMLRQAAVDFTFYNCDIKRGDYISISCAAANRDPRIFSNPDVFDLHRSDQLNLSFGYGVHYCLGRLLGRLVARHMFRYMLTSWPHLQLKNSSPSWHMGAALRRVDSLVCCIK